jgi:hypothetical protein
MQRLATPLLIIACFIALALACFSKALLQGEQFAYRDAAHFYYPLYQRVQAEWDAHRTPLWEPEENGGMPLLGNPTAAVLYPGKLVFALVPYPLGARLYVVMHIALAFAAMLALARSFGTSWAGSGLGALAYAFGAPVLFQYCNIIYLVGAAWLPLGIRAVDRWLRQGRRIALLELAVVLAMETIGGDPESAYLTGVCAAGHAVLIACAGARSNADSRPWWLRWYVVGPLVVLAAALWIAVTLAVALRVPAVRPVVASGQPPVRLPWMPWVAPVVAGAWAIVGLVLLDRWWRARKSGVRTRLVSMLFGLVAAAGLAAALSAAQLLPVMEFTRQSGRAAGEGPHDIFPFSLEPVRIAEFVWPNFFGTSFHGNRSWLTALQTTKKVTKVWVPSLYVGGLALVLALGGLGFGGTAPWRHWMTAIAIVSLAASFGEFAGPLWWARLAPSVADDLGIKAPEFLSKLGKNDPEDVSSIRFDRHLRDGDGSPYWILATALPGFRQFRFPSKLLTFTVLALAALAGQGWDALVAGDPKVRRRAASWTFGLLGLTILVLAVTFSARGAIEGWMHVRDQGSSFGPLDRPGALAETQRALVQTLLVLSLGLVLILRGSRRPQLASALVLLATSADLAAANARCVVTVPQALMDREPEVLRIIAEAEKEKPTPAPFRVHRMPIWNPLAWHETASDDRVRDFVEWERETIQPKYGIPFGVQYTMTLGVAELYDYEWFFGGFTRTIRPEMIDALRAKPGQKVVVYPRRAYDMWNTRYFILPSFPNKWDDEHRGYASFLDHTELIYPTPDAFKGPGGNEKGVAWMKTKDYQILRNLSVYPRAWVVHAGRYVKTLSGMSREERNAPMQEILFENDSLWHDNTRTVFDPKLIAWVDESDKKDLAPFFPGSSPTPDETVTVTRYEPDRVELEAVLERPGLVVLAEVFYPGWTLTIDGRTAPIYRANRMMRGVAVTAGKHRLVLRFRPPLFRYGLVISCLGLVVLGTLGVWFGITSTRGNELTESS